MRFKLEEDVSETDEEPEEKRNGKTEKPGKQEYLESKQPQEKKKTKPKREEMVVQELVVMLNSPLVNRSATDIRLRTRYHTTCWPYPPGSDFQSSDCGHSHQPGDGMLGDSPACGPQTSALPIFLIR